MKFVTQDENDIAWMRNPEGYAVADTVQQIKDAGKWEEFLQLHQDDETGEIDCDNLYDCLRYESCEALLDVGLHYTEATANVKDVAAAWDAQNAPAHVRRNADGSPMASFFDQTLSFDIIDEDGAESTVDLEPDDVVELVGKPRANTGEWDDEAPDCATFDMWNDRR